MKTKVIPLIALMFAVIINFTSINAFALSDASKAPKEAQQIKVLLNAKDIGFPDAKPIINKDNRILVPIRFVAEVLKAKVDWIPQKNKVVIKSDKTIELEIGKNSATVDGKNITLDTSTEISKGRTYVPLRFVSETFGATVKWDSKYFTASITTKDMTPKDLEFTSVYAGDSNTVITNKYGKAFIAKNDASVYGDIYMGDVYITEDNVKWDNLEIFNAIDNVEKICNNYNGTLKKDGTIWIWGDYPDRTNNMDIYKFQEPFMLKDAGNDNVLISDGINGVLQLLKKDGTVWKIERKSELDQSFHYNYKEIVSPIKGLNEVASISGSETNGICVKKDGTVLTWDSSYKPKLVEGLDNIAAVSCGNGFSIALSRDGNVYSWGNNDLGQLGNGTSISNQTPTIIKGLSDIISICASSNGAMALQKDGTVWVWGSNDMGQCGIDKSTAYCKEPARVEGISDVKAISAGKTHKAVIKNDGTAWNIGGITVPDTDVGNEIDYLNTKYNKKFKKVCALESELLVIDENGTFYRASIPTKFRKVKFDNANGFLLEVNEGGSYYNIAKDINKNTQGAKTNNLNIIASQQSYKIVDCDIISIGSGFALTNSKELCFYHINYDNNTIKFTKINSINNVKSFKRIDQKVAIITDDNEFKVIDCSESISHYALYGEEFDPKIIPIPNTADFKNVKNFLEPNSYTSDLILNTNDNNLIFIISLGNINYVKRPMNGAVVKKILYTSPTSTSFILTESAKVIKLDESGKLKTLDFEKIQDISDQSNMLFLIKENGGLIMTKSLDDNYEKNAKYYDLDIKEITKISENKYLTEYTIEYINTKNQRKTIKIDYDNNIFNDLTDKSYARDSLIYQI